MFYKLLGAQDVAGGSYALLLIATLVTTVLLLFGTAWASRRWKVAVALCAVTTLAAALHYALAAGIWFETGKTTIAYRYLGWFITMPLQVVVLYFFVAAISPLPLGLFWRLLVAAVVMVLARYMGEAGLIYPTLGFLIGLALWLYILGEAFFGRMAEGCQRDGDASVRRGYFWLRLIIALGWAIYPLCYFISAFTSGVDARPLAITYNLADLVNLVAFALAVLTIATNASNVSAATSRG